MISFLARHYRDGRTLRFSLAHGRIGTVEPTEVPESDAAGLPFVAPGLFDIQLNGYGGAWFGSEVVTVSSVSAVVRAYAAHGITQCFPTLITSSFDAMMHGIRTIRRAQAEDELVRDIVRGIHLEGPYISPVDGARGAHPQEHVRPASCDEFFRWQKAADNTVRLVTLAPEVSGGIDFVRRIACAGVVIAIGHTVAPAEVITQAADAGARLSTHLGNGCPAMMHRHENVIWPQLADDRLTASVISDGWHLPRAPLQCLLRCKSPSRVIITCDVSGFAGCAPGRYEYGGVSVEVLDDTRIVVAGQRTLLAGSSATTGDCVIHMMRSCGISLADAWDLASLRPAALFGEPVCNLRTGDEATLTLFRTLPEAGTRSHSGRASAAAPGFQPVATIVKGRVVSGVLTPDS